MFCSLCIKCNRPWDIYCVIGISVLQVRVIILLYLMLIKWYVYLNSNMDMYVSVRLNFMVKYSILVNECIGSIKIFSVVCFNNFQI